MHDHTTEELILAAEVRKIAREIQQERIRAGSSDGGPDSIVDALKTAVDELHIIAGVVSARIAER